MSSVTVFQAAISV